MIWSSPVCGHDSRSDGNRGDRAADVIDGSGHPGSQRHSLGQRSLSHVGCECVTRGNVDAFIEDALEPRCSSRAGKPPVAHIQINEEVDVGAGAVLTARDRPEHLNVRRVVTARRQPDEASVGADLVIRGACTSRLRGASTTDRFSLARMLARTRSSVSTDGEDVPD